MQQTMASNIVHGLKAVYRTWHLWGNMGEGVPTGSSEAGAPLA